MNSLARLVFVAVSCTWASAALAQDVILSRVSSDAANGVQAGEAAVVALPGDPDTIVTIWLGTMDTANPTAGGPEDGVIHGYCGIGRSTDGGRNWSTSIAPYQNATVPGTVPICGDPQGEVMSDGTIVFTGVQLGSPTDFIQSISSFDGGQTWAAPSAPFGAQQALAAALANQGVPDMGPGRQFMAVDRITGEIHIQSQVDVATTGRQLTVSTDRGRTWSAPRNTGSTAFGPIGAAYGIVGGVYTSGDLRIFQTSTDRGRTWVRNTMPVGTGVGGAGARTGITAADPTKKGRFAVLLGRGDSQLEVWITSDAGRTPGGWARTAVFNTAPGDHYDMSWIAFGPTGALGVVWRYLLADGSYHTDGVVSADGGTTWAAPVRLTAERGPSPPQSTGIGDDCACNLHLTGSRLVTVFADMFTGSRELWFGSFDYTTP